MRLRIVINNEPRWFRRRPPRAQTATPPARAHQSEPPHEPRRAHGDRARTIHAPPRAAGNSPPPSPTAHADSHGPAALLGAWLMAAGGAVLRFFCSLRGHNYVMKVQPRHLALHCPACGHTTKGWKLDEAHPVTRQDLSPRLLELVRRRS